jgi:ribosomal protein S18 acetylase RimI-like enzyme
MKRSERPNAMFVAREAVPLSSPLAPVNTPLILDASTIINIPFGMGVDDDYVKGRVLGFVEVTRKPYGLPCESLRSIKIPETRSVGDADVPTKRKKLNNFSPSYPVLTNLAVAPEARQSGVGSRLLGACEDVILTWNPPCSDIILEVEEDNESALEWYKKRGYQMVFADPACRRYDANGWLLRKVRCTKICMRKNVKHVAAGPVASFEDQVSSGLVSLRSRVFQSLRETIFQRQ